MKWPWVSWRKLRRTGLSYRRALENTKRRYERLFAEERKKADKSKQTMDEITKRLDKVIANAVKTELWCCREPFGHYRIGADITLDATWVAAQLDDRYLRDTVIDAFVRGFERQLYMIDAAGSGIIHKAIKEDVERRKRRLYLE